MFYTLWGCGNAEELGPTDNPPPIQEFPNPAPTKKLHIALLTYNPTDGLVACTLKNGDKQSVSGKYALQITPGAGTQATIKDVSLQAGYSIKLGKITLAAGQDFIKTFPIEWDGGVIGEFSFQLIRMEGDKRTPIGEQMVAKFRQESLHEAIEKEDIALMKELLNSPSTDVTSLDTLNRSAIFWMIDKLPPGAETENTIKVLLHKMQKDISKEKVKTILNQMDKLGHTPLSQAALKRFSADLILLLLQAGADPNKFSTDSTSPLYWAIYHQNTNLVEALTNHGADVNKKEQDGQTLLHEVIRHTTQKNIEVMKEIIQILHNHGANTKATNKAGQRPVDLVQGAHLPLEDAQALSQLLQGDWRKNY